MSAVRLLLVCALGLSAQVRYPGQYPPGQYPPGQYPPGRGRYPNPNDPRNDPNNNPRNNPPGRGRNGKDSKANAKLPIVTSGMFRAAGGSQFALEADDHRIITYRTNGQ